MPRRSVVATVARLTYCRLQLPTHARYSDMPCHHLCCCLVALLLSVSCQGCCSCEALQASQWCQGPPVHVVTKPLQHSCPVSPKCRLHHHLIAELLPGLCGVYSYALGLYVVLYRQRRCPTRWYQRMVHVPGCKSRRSFVAWAQIRRQGSPWRD